MAFQMSKKTDRRRSTSISIEYIDGNGNVESRNSDLAASTIGTVTQSNFNKTTSFRPGVFSVNPIEHLRWEGKSSAIEQKDRVFLSSNYPGSWPTEAGRKVYGDVAANMQQYPDSGIEPFATAIQPSSSHKTWALNNAYAELANADFDTALWLAELRETIEMLRNPFKSFRQLYERIFVSTRKASFTSFKKSVDDAASQWLEYRYGLMPVILDIQNIRKLYEDGLSRRERLINRGRKGKKFEVIQTAALEKRFDRTAHMYFVEYLVQRFVEESISGSVYYKHNSGTWEDLGLLGLDPTKIPALLWELTTLSFVADWVVGIGDWLSAILPNPALDILGNSISYRYKETNIISTRRATYYPDGRFAWVPMKSQHIAVRESVVRLVNQPKPWLPALEPSVLNLNRSIDSLSLIWGNCISPRISKIAKATTKLR